MSHASLDSKLAAPVSPAGIADAPDSMATAPGRLWPVVLASLLGIVVVLGVGFGPGIAHDAAHDTRHTLAFPCH